MNAPKSSTPATLVPKFDFFSHSGRSFFTLINGEVFACGDNENAQLGLGDQRNRAKPEKVKLEAKVKEVKTTRNSTFFITNYGEVFACGWNLEGQLGIGSKEKYITIPQKVSLKAKVKKIVTDIGTTFFITEEAKVFVCGVNYDIKFRLGTKNDYLLFATPQEIVFETKIKDVIANDGSIFFITADDKILASGNNMYGQLGIDSQIKDITVPQEVVFKTNVKKIITYSGATFFITKDGEVFACGFNLDSSLGLGIAERYIFVPKQYSLNEKIEEVIIASGATFFMTREGKVLAFGDNFYGQLGLGDQNNRAKPEEIKLGAKVKKIVAHKGSTFFIIEDDGVLACGWNFRSQLGIGSKEKYIVKPQAVLLGETKVNNVIFNGDFSLFITENNGVCLSGIDKYGFIGEPLSEISNPIVALNLFQI